ncbi:MAG TPA: hypothetical protein VEH84_00815 [Alphaproteobacteria bacterium]|nr:hypothetical protein [Alphaproteobacteria bacterium]
MADEMRRDDEDTDRGGEPRDEGESRFSAERDRREAERREAALSRRSQQRED